MQKCRRFNKTECTNDEFLSALLGFHSFTGCDTTSTFAGRGKIKPLILMGKSELYLNAFSTLGPSFGITDVDLSALESLTCHIMEKKMLASKEFQSTTSDTTFTVERLAKFRVMHFLHVGML